MRNSNISGPSIEEIEKLIEKKINELKLKSEEAIANDENDLELESNLEYIDIDDD